MGVLCPYVRGMADEPDFEELEHIPWAALAARRNVQPVRIVLVLAGLAAVVVLSVVVSRVFLGDAGADAVIAEPLVVAAAATPQQEPIPQPEPQSAVAGIETYSEADLMLIDTEEEGRLAIAHAEWFVRDYLTIDGDPVVSERVAALVPSRAAATDAVLSTYVEWVDAFSISSPDPGTYEVEVLYRLLVDKGDGFARQPAEAILVGISIGVDGTATLLSVADGIPAPALHGIGETPS